MPHLQELWSELSNERDDVAFVCVNPTDDTATIQGYWTKNGFGMTVARDPRRKAAAAMRVPAFPTNYVIGPDGKVLFRGVGYDPQIFARLKRALASTRKRPSGH